ncbi:hypothetical protein BDV35DRAFT_374970 [Aspergillus flavus]|uniref:Uncharacterized protein n=1 Tax=Aspergillus flavus TaxID=5059 RepID=A0A5N6GDZ4_ASPFL|nr:hypothetical protein BDV35DRAFT_374970 [Aspergillus flavus]
MCINVISRCTMDPQDHEPDLLAELQQSTYLFLKLGGRLPEDKHLPRPADCFGMSIEHIKGHMRSFQEMYLFPHLMKMWHEQDINIDMFLSQLREKVGQNVNQNIGRCLRRFRLGFPPDIPAIFVHVRPITTEYCKRHWVIIVDCDDTKICLNRTQAGLEWNRDYHTDNFLITYSVQNRPYLQEMTECASQVLVENLGHMCSCAHWVSKVVSDYHDRGFVRDKSHDGIHVRDLYLKLIYSVLEKNLLG